MSSVPPIKKLMQSLLSFIRVLNQQPSSSAAAPVYFRLV